MTCIHRGEIWTHLPNKLCGLRGTLEPIYRCRLHVICTHRKYRHGQTEKCCLACDDFSPCTKEEHRATENPAPAGG